MPASYLKIAGELIQDAILTSVEVVQALNDHWWCKISCRQTEDRRFPLEASLGRDFQLCTYDEGGAEHVAFDGFLLGGNLNYEIFGSYTVQLTGVTRSYKLGLAPQEAYFRKKTLADVAQALAGADGLSATVKCRALPPRNYVQWGESDFEFLKRLVYEHQAWLRPNAKGLEIYDQFQPGTQLSWREERGLFNFRLRGRLSQPAFSGTHYDARQMSSKTLAKVSKEAPFSGAGARMVAAVQKQSAKLPPGFLHLDSRAATEAEYRQTLERESVRSIGGSVTGQGNSRNDALRPGDTVEIQGPLDASGTYGITRVVHRWVRTGYQNEFWCTPWKSYSSTESLDPPKIYGYIPARVVDQNDPRHMGRIKVQYDWLEEGETAWARMATPAAGGDRGFLFLPETGDEVLIGFEHGDPERPFLVGSLWNGVDQAPRAEFWGGDIPANDVKRIVTKSGHRIQLSDKQGKESIVVATPNYLKIGLLENADETGRSMLAVHSENGDIVLSAPNGRIHFQSRHFSREVGVQGSAARHGPAGSAPRKPKPNFPAQVAALHAASKSGAALCAT